MFLLLTLSMYLSAGFNRFKPLNRFEIKIVPKKCNAQFLVVTLTNSKKLLTNVTKTCCGCSRYTSDPSRHIHCSNVNKASYDVVAVV